MPTQITQNKIFPWLGWFVVSVAGLYQFILQTSTSVMIPDLEKAFSLNSFGVSLLSSSFFYTYLICQIPAGMIVDHVKPRRTVVLCQSLLGVACLLFAFSNEVWMAGVSRILMGLFAAPTIVAVLYLAARSLPEKYFALVLGLTEMMGMLGGVVGESLLARSMIHFGWRYTIIFCAIMAFTMAFLAWVFVRDKVRIESGLPESHEPNRRSVWRDLISMLAIPQAWINGLFCGLLFGLIAAFGSFWCVSFLMSLYGIPLGKAADASSMIFVGAAFGAPIIGWFSDKWDVRRNLMLFFTFAALVVMSVIIYVPVSLAWMFLLLLLLGFVSGVYVLPFAVIRDITPPHMRGAAMGYINMMCILIGSPLLQPLIGWILHTHPDASLRAYQNALLVLPVSLVVAFVLAIFVQEEKI